MTRRRQPPIDPNAIVRVRRAVVSDGRSDLEVGMLFAIRAAGLPEPAREWHFDWCCEHPKRWHEQPRAVPPLTFYGPASRFHEYRHGRDWRFDFAYPAFMLALEIEGGTHSGGRHTRGMGFEEDATKYAEALLLGWRVLRVTGSMVSSGAALDYLERLLKGAT